MGDASAANKTASRNKLRTFTRWVTGPQSKDMSHILVLHLLTNADSPGFQKRKKLETETLIPCTFLSYHDERPQTRSAKVANNRIVHFEIPANNPAALTQFYAGLFGWKFNKADLPGPEYWLCDTGSTEPGINGAVMQRQHPQQPWTNYVDVDCIDTALAKAAELGGTVALPKMPIPGVGAVAAFVDPQGNICGLWEQAKK
jgi:predicted enzyme related to lactoylglutathione lyase